MDEIQFADGFDTTDRLLLGLGAGPLALLVATAAAAYLLTRSSMPAVITFPTAAFMLAVAAGVAWLRVAGRPGTDWAMFAMRYLRRRQTGLLISAGDANLIPLFGAPTAAAPAAPNPPAGEGPAARSARRLTFFSLRGGTGRSTLATELACLLAATPTDGTGAARFKVALLDLDLRSASVSVRLGLPNRTVVDFAGASPTTRRVRDFMIKHQSGAHVLLGPAAPVPADWPVTPGVLREILNELDADDFDVVVMDLSPELSALTSTALSSADDVFVVLTPTAGGIHDAYRTTESLRRLGFRHQLRYVVNRARADTDISEPMADLRGQVVGEIPDDHAVVIAENQHRLVALGGSGPAAGALQRLARRVGRELQFPAAG